MINNQHEQPIVNVPDQYVVQTVFDRIQRDKEELENAIKEMCQLFLDRYNAFEIVGIQVFDVYCGQKCVVNLKLK